MKALGMITVLALLATSSGLAQGLSFLRTLLTVAGISATPSAQKAPGEHQETGDIWISSPVEGPRLRLSRDNRYRSPVFAPGDSSILALKGSTLVQIPASGGEPKTLHTLTRAFKLLGFTPTARSRSWRSSRTPTAPRGSASSRWPPDT
jgi:hypothetical protein